MQSNCRRDFSRIAGEKAVLDGWRQAQSSGPDNLLRRHLPTTLNYLCVGDDPVHGGDTEFQPPGDRGPLQTFSVQSDHLGGLGARRRLFCIG
jgi:hypothetical protein